MKKEVALAVLKAFKLLEEMSGLHKNLIDILAFVGICTAMVLVPLIHLPSSNYGQQHGQHA